MKKRMKYLAVVGGVLVLGTGGSVVLAQTYLGDDAEEVAAVQRARISLAQAVTAAERGSSGRAIEASMEADRGRAVYEVTVFAENRMREVQVDPQTGRVLNTRIDWD